MRSRVAGVLLALTLGSVVGAGCDGSGEDGVSRDAQVYVATIRDILANQPRPADPDVLPVVYVVGVGETKIPADVQAEVAVELDEDADIRFADQRSEAMLEKEEHVPIRDQGLLVALGELPPEADPVNLAVEVYRSEEDWSKVVLTVDRGSSQWTVTSSSVLPVEGS
jgi:hypothetical protein